MSQNILVSVIIPTYKRPTYLKRAIQSVLQQTYQNIEVIVVDDNNPSSEGRVLTEQVMDFYKDNEKVLYIKHEYNKNGSAARNTGARESKGEYLMFLDDDDEFYPQKVESQLNCLLNKSTDFQACYSNYDRFDSKGKLIDKCGENREGNLYLEALKRNFFVQAGSNLMVSRKAFFNINGFDESFLRNQDLEFLARLLLKYKICYSDIKGSKINLGDHSGLSSMDFGETTEQYKTRFKAIIDAELKEDEAKELEIFLALQVYRFYFLKKDFKKSRLVKKKYKIKSNLIFRYFFHLLHRKITKTCCGFMGSIL